MHAVLPEPNYPAMNKAEKSQLQHHSTPQVYHPVLFHEFYAYDHTLRDVAPSLKNGRLALLRPLLRGHKATEAGAPSLKSDMHRNDGICCSTLCIQ